MSSANSPLLNEEERLALKQSAQAVQTAVSGHLAKAQSAGQVVYFINHLQTGIDRLVQQAQSAAIACQPGCSHCCHAEVKVLAPEVFAIAREIHNLPAPMVDKIKQRLAEHANQDRKASAWNQRPACPFLENHLCTIYAIRPAVCRRAHSLDKDACASSNPEIPQQLGLSLGAEALLHGTASAYENQGLDAGYYYFSRALLLVLSDVGAEERWLAGEKVFGFSS